MARMSELKFVKGGIAVDDRGTVRFCNDFSFANVKRFYQVQNHRCGFIRAWHGHKHETKYVWVTKGSAIIGVVPLSEEKGDLSEVKTFVLSDQQPGILQIPSGNFNGFMNLEEDTRIIFFSSSGITESAKDDIRKPYDYWNIWQENYR